MLPHTACLRVADRERVAVDGENTRSRTALPLRPTGVRNSPIRVVCHSQDLYMLGVSSAAYSAGASNLIGDGGFLRVQRNQTSNFTCVLTLCNMKLILIGGQGMGNRLRRGGLLQKDQATRRVPCGHISRLLECPRQFRIPGVPARILAVISVWSP